MKNQLLFLRQNPEKKEKRSEIREKEREKAMLEFVKAVNEWMWGLILLIILCGTGIFFTISSERAAALYLDTLSHPAESGKRAR